MGIFPVQLPVSYPYIRFHTFSIVESSKLINIYISRADVSEFSLLVFVLYVYQYSPLPVLQHMFNFFSDLDVLALHTVESLLSSFQSVLSRQKTKLALVSPLVHLFCKNIIIDDNIPERTVKHEHEGPIDARSFIFSLIFYIICEHPKN